MTTLVTGATGFVGAAVLRCLTAAGHNVRALVRPNSDRRNLSGVDCEIVNGDLAEPESLERAVRGCEAVFHVAADYRLWVPDREKMNRVNVQGTMDLIRAAAAAGVSRIVYTSSVATLRLRDDGIPADEESQAEFSDMIGAYKQSKFLAEREVKRLVADTGVPVVIVGAENPFGVSWETDNTILFGQGEDGIWRVSGDGGTAENVIKVEKSEIAPMLVRAKLSELLRTPGRQ
jgi:dihydroflavonol-4-reductase